MTLRLISNYRYGALLSEFPPGNKIPQNWAPGTEIAADDAPVLARVVGQPGATSFYFLASGGALPAGIGDVYVDPVAGNDANLGTVTQPVATLQAGSSRAPLLAGASGCTIHVLSSCALGVNPRLNAPRLPGGQAVVVRGAVSMQPGGVPLAAAAGGTTGSLASRAGGTIVGAVGGWTVNAWAGYVARFTAGPLAGVRAIIQSNTANTLTCRAVFASAPDATSTFVIESQDTVLSWTADGTNTTTSGLVLEGYEPLVFDDIAFDCGNGVFAYFRNTQFNGVRFDAVSGALVVFAGQCDVGGAFWSGVQNGTTTCGCMFNATTGSFIAEAEAGVLVLVANSQLTKFRWFNVRQSIVTMAFASGSGFSCYASQGAFIGTQNMLITNPVSGPFSAMFYGAYGGAVALTNVAITNLTDGGTPIQTFMNGRALLLAVTGTGNTGNGGCPVNIQGASVLECSDMNTGTTIAGTVTAGYTLGGNAARTWAAGSALTYDTDIAALTPQLCVATIFS